MFIGGLNTAVIVSVYKRAFGLTYSYEWNGKWFTQREQSGRGRVKPLDPRD